MRVRVGLHAAHYGADCVTRYAMQVPPQSPQSGGTAPNSTAGSPLDLLGRAVSRAFRGGM